MSPHQLEFTLVRHWLERKVRARAAANLTIAATHVILGLLVVTGTAWFLAWLLLLGFDQAVAIARFNLGLPVRFERSGQGTLILAGLLLVALFLGNSRAGVVDLSQFGKLNWRSRSGSLATMGLLGGGLARLLYLGPHLLVQAGGFFRKGLLWKQVDREVVAGVLHLLATAGQRVAYDELARRVRGFSLSRTVPQLQLFEGILFLTSPPTGLGLTSALREEMTGQRWPHDPRGQQSGKMPSDPANRIRGRRVVFFCAGCTLKLRVLIASENISIQCPRCRAAYRVVGIENDRIQMQRLATGFRPRRPATPPRPPPRPPPPPPPREPFDHELLEIGRDASADEIKAAYRKLLKENHPDFFTNAPPAELAKAEEYTKKLNRAYRSMMLRFEK